MSTKYYKNIASPAETLNYNGQDILTGEYFLIPAQQEVKWIYDSDILDDLGVKLLVAKSDDGTQDIIDTADALKYLTGEIVEIDEEGRQVLLMAAGKKGWTYIAHSIEIETSILSGVFACDWEGNSRSDITLRHYNNSDVELVAGTQAELDSSCEKTVITFHPSVDFQLISGNIHQISTPTVDIRLWVVGGIINNSGIPWEYPVGTFNIKEFVGGINMKFLSKDDHIETDGRASKLMIKDTGAPYNANQFQFIIRHPVGHQHKLQFVLEYFRE